MALSSDLVQHLPPKEQRGSKPRCHILTHGTKDEVARRLTSLIHPFGQVSASDRWMPIGFDATKEAQLHETDSIIVPRDYGPATQLVAC